MPTTPTQSLGTQVSATSFYPNLGNADSAFPNAAPVVAPTPVINNVVTTSSTAKKDFNTHSNTLDTMLANLNQTPTKSGNTATIGNTNDAYTQMLDRSSQNSDLATKALIATIQAGRSNQENRINSQYENYKRGLQLLGIQHNDAQATPDLLMGHIKQAENEHQQKLQSIDVETNKALMDAKVAKDNGDLAVLKEKMSYIKDLNQQKQDYLKNIADNLSYSNKIAESTIQGAYNDLIKLSPEKQQQYIQHVASSFGIPITSVQAAVQAEQERKAGKITKSKIQNTKPLSILDIQRYNELYPDAGITAGDTEAEANAKVKSTNSPEAKLKSEFEDYKTGGASYEEIVNNINDDPNLSEDDKKSAIEIAKQVYEVTNDQVNQTQQSTTKNNISIPNSILGINSKGIIDNIANFLFK